MSRLARMLKPRAALHPPFWTQPSINFGSYVGERETIENDFESIVQRCLKENGVVFACIAARQMVFSEIRFAWRRFEDGRPGDVFGNSDLELLERPWPNGTTGELTAHLEQDDSLAGNCFIGLVDDQHGARLRRLRPDWTTIITGSPTDDPFDLRARPIGYVYKSPRSEPVLLTTDQVAHYSPIPDPVAQWRGMSWLSTVLPEVRSDKAATKHKAKFFENGAQVGTILSYDPTISPDDFAAHVALFKEQHEGVGNAYKTLHVGGGADPKVMSANLQQLDLKNTQGRDESRIASAAGVHPVILGLPEALQGSSLNAGNYGQIRRRFADITIRPLWRTAAAALETLVTPPDKNTRLWFDTSDVAFLRDDAKQEAEIRDKQAQTITRLVREGFTAESAIKAVRSGDWTVLEHSGLFSVQLQQAGTQEANEA